MIDLDEDVTRSALKDCLDSGWTAQEIAEELGLDSVADVMRWCAYHELATPWQAQRAAAKVRAQEAAPGKVRATYVAAGCNLTATAKALGITPYHVKRHLQAWYLTHPTHEQEDAREAAQLKTKSARAASKKRAQQRAAQQQRRRELAQIARAALEGAGAKAADVNAIINAIWLR